MKVDIGNYDNDSSPRKEEVHIDDFDIWSLDHSLALIISPALKMLKASQCGAPIVSNHDVPEQLHTAEDFEDVDEDPNYFKRWNYVLDEMIWAFDIIAEDNGDAQFHTGRSDTYWQALDENHDELGEPFPFDQEVNEYKDKARFYTMIKGPKDTTHFDVEGYTKHHERINNGTRLFGVYYRSLWD